MEQKAANHSKPPAKSMGKDVVAAFQGSPREEMGGRGVADFLRWLKFVFTCIFLSLAIKTEEKVQRTQPYYE